MKFERDRLLCRSRRSGRCREARAVRPAALALALLALGSLSCERLPAPPPAYTVRRTPLERYPLGGVYQMAAIEWSPDGTKLAVARMNGEVLLLPERRTLWAGSRKPMWYPERLTRVWWSPDGRQVARLHGDDNVLEIVTLGTGRRQVVAKGIISAAWLPASRPGAQGAGPELVCVKRDELWHNHRIVVRLLGSPGEDPTYDCRPIHVPIGTEPVALSPDGRVLAVGLDYPGTSYDHGAVSVWHPPYPEGRARWTHRMALFWEYACYVRAVWSEPMQAVVLSQAGATDGSHYTLQIVTRADEIYYMPSHFASPAYLASHPVWLGNRLIFAEVGVDRLGMPPESPRYMISSLEVPRGRHEVLFFGAEDYGAPAVSADNRRLAYAERKKGRWEVMVVAIEAAPPRDDR